AYIHLYRGKQQFGRAKPCITRFAHSDKFVFAYPIMHMDAVLPLLRNSGFPAILLASRRFIIVAQKQARRPIQRKQAPDRAVQRASIPAWKISTSRTVVRHKQGVADEGGIGDKVSDIGRRVAGDMHYRNL